MFPPLTGTMPKWNYAESPHRLLEGEPQLTPDCDRVAKERKIPDNPLEFVKTCLKAQRIYWTYHVNMRIAGRHITRDEIVEATDSYEVIESYPEDKYLPSYLLLGNSGVSGFHILFAADVEGDNVRIVTAYRPDQNEWEADLRTRRKTE